MGESKLQFVGEGVLTGAVAALIAWPLLLRNHAAYKTLTLIPTYPSGVENVAALLLFFIVVPAALKLVFRGVLFDCCQLWLGVLTASVVISLFYAYFWPLPAPVPSFIFGLASSAIYYRSRNVLPSVTASIVFMVGTAGLLTWINL